MINQILQNSPSGLFVLRVSAMDPDLGLNAKISYSLEGTRRLFFVVSVIRIAVNLSGFC